MTEQRDTGGHAFPQPLAIEPSGDIRSSSDFIDEGGMTLLDWFAGQALSALAQDVERDGMEDDSEFWLRLARCSYGVATAMLAEKRRREQGDA